MPYAARSTQHTATDDTIGAAGVTDYAGGKISACCLVCGSVWFGFDFMLKTDERNESANVIVS